MTLIKGNEIKVVKIPPSVWRQALPSKLARYLRSFLHLKPRSRLSLLSRCTVIELAYELQALALLAVLKDGNYVSAVQPPVQHSSFAVFLSQVHAVDIYAISCECVNPSIQPIKLGPVSALLLKCFKIVPFFGVEPYCKCLLWGWRSACLVAEVGEGIRRAWKLSRV